MEKETIDRINFSFEKAINSTSNFSLMPKAKDFSFIPKKKNTESKEVVSLFEKRKEAAKKWLKNKDNFALLSIITLAIVIRLYYFWLTKSQALWWDEADYLAYAKTLAGMGTNWIATSQHNSIFSYIVAFFFKLGFSESIIKFILEIVPSVLLVFLTYKISEKIYKDKKIAIISSFIMAVFWNILFNSMRFHLGAPALLFAFLAVYVFFIGYEKKEKIFGKISSNWAIPMAAIFTIISYALRRNYAFFGIFFLVYMISTKKITTLVKDKYNWIALGISAALLFLTEKFIFISSVGGVASEYYHPELAINWVHIQFLTLFFQGGTLLSSIFLWLSILGLIVIASRLLLTLDCIRKKDNIEIKFDLFLMISLIITMAYFIFVQRDTSIGEARWYFPILLASLIFVSKGAIFISDQFKKYNKHLSIIILFLLIIIGGYYQIEHADQVIKVKIPSYAGIRDAGLKIQEISSPEDVIISSSVTQAAYYSERTVVHFSDIAKLHSEKEFEETLGHLEENSSIKYIAISFSEPNNPKWARNEAVEYARDANGQIVRLRWEVPFMDTVINFQTGEQRILEEKSYGSITFKLVSIEQDVFIYEIIRS